MSRDEADRALAVLGPAYDRIAAAMYGLDSHPGLGFLRGSTLAGTTREVAGDVQEVMTQLWAQFAALGQQLDTARSTGDLSERIGLDAGGLPLDGAGQPAQRVTLMELAQRLETSTAKLAELLTDVDHSVSTLTDRLAALTDALGGGAGVASLAAELAAVREQALADPLEVARGGHPVADRLDRLEADLAFARNEYPRRIAELRDTIGQVEAAEAEATKAYAVVRVKIADPGLPEVPASVPALRRRLSDVEEFGTAGDWGRLAAVLAALARDAGQAHEYAMRLRTAADGLLDRRTELRGRLDAYRAKAARLGFGEHPELSDRHREAYELLFTSPCELPAATRAVFRYQQVLAGLIDRKETVI
jgi:hypothetical protein